ncbi:hypothetical protein NDU88_003769 [Pleurodeles waltl]|uniref:Uncharacterized protein n=1 Tax=Pleurodeles waltl TaxID=8319 RepID=A0AAV7T683_PLEWA|nr:hypothetical protein NDU88_003769 [Pleurodeles waltl]
MLQATGRSCGAESPRLGRLVGLTNGGWAALMAEADQKDGWPTTKPPGRWNPIAAVIPQDSSASCTRQHPKPPGSFTARPAALGRAESRQSRCRVPMSQR